MINRNFISNATQSLLLGAAALVISMGGAHANNSAIGSVTLTLGKAVIVDSAGKASPVQRGSQIFAGDRVETSEGGHVHVKFVDGALVSVRPTSRLFVESYEYDPAQVQQSLVRFRLEQGVVRAISGAAAEGARERFRLNTPLVAIGVRGTDFVVRTDASQTLATVNQGAIVMAPFGDHCPVQGNGPCGTATSKLLTAGMQNQQLEYNTYLAQPEIKTIPELALSKTVVAVAKPMTANTLDSSSARDSLKTTANDDVVSGVVVQGAVSLVEDSSKKPSVKPEPPIVAPPPGPTSPSVVVPPGQLAWGRYTDAPSASDLSLPMDQARQGRSVTIGNNEYRLYRDESIASVLSPSLGAIGFALGRSEAHVVLADGSRQAATVTDGKLTLDFGVRRFFTTLSVTSQASGATGLQATGFLGVDGIFYSRNPGEAVAGAVALDAKSAGYFFEKALTGGTLSGITLWGR